MTNIRLLSSAAVALAFAVATLSAAFAQIKPNPEPAPAAQQNAPPAKIAPPINAGEHQSPVQEITAQTATPPEPGHIKAEDSAGKNNASTAGQGAAAGSAKLSSEQRSKIAAVIKNQNAKAEHVNFSVSIGTRVPPTVHYYPLPTEVITIYPEWRGYNYILIGDQIVVIDPDTHEIVAVLEA